MAQTLLRAILLFLLALVVQNGIAQTPTILFQSKSIHDGLPDNRVDIILKDQLGYLWCSTIFGICRYDGYDFKEYRLGDKVRGLKGMVADSSGHIWCIYDRELMFYSPAKETFITISPSKDDSFYSSGLTNILKDSQGNIWVSNRQSALAQIRKDGSISKKYKFPSRNIVKMIEGEKGTLWLAMSDDTIFLFDKSATNPVENSFSIKISANRITTIEWDHRDKLWIGTQDEGLYSYDIQSDSLQHFLHNPTDQNSLSNNNILSLLADDRNLWIGTDGGGLNLYQAQEKRFYTFKKRGNRLNTLADNAVLSFYKDEGESKTIWIGTVHGGFSYFQNQLINFNLPLQKFDIDFIGKQSWRILEDSRGHLWLGTDRDGLRRYDPTTGEVRIYRHDPKDHRSLAGNNVLSIFEDSNGKIWVGSQLSDVSLFDSGSNDFDRFTINAFSAFEEDKSGNIWIGNGRKVKVIVRKNNHYEIDSDASDSISAKIPDVIKTLKQDSKGNMWVGTTSGLGVLDLSGSYTRYQNNKNDSTSISGNFILSIFEDSDFSIWVGTLGNGLNHFDRRTEKFERFGPKNQLPANHIRNIWEDKSNNIWVSTNLGLSKLDRNNQIKNFNRNDGIFVSSPGLSYPLRNGNIIQGGIHGLNIFDPGTLNRTDLPPKTIFTSLEIRGENPKNIPFAQFPKSSDGTPHIEIARETANFTINFLAFNFLDPGKNQYAYKVSEQEDTWHNIGNQRSISFSYLPAGTYNLQVKASNEHGIWNDRGIKLKFTVLPSIWEKPFIRILLFLGLIGIIIVGYKWRLKKIHQQREKLKEQVALKTRELKIKQQEMLEQTFKLMESEKLNSKLKQKQLKDELDFKISELTNRTLRSVHKNKLLTDIKSELNQSLSQEKINPGNYKSLVSQINDTLTFDSNWNDFYELFDQVHVSFIQKLKQLAPDLTEREIRLCALIKLDFSSQDIATIFGISFNSVKVSKYRLRQKLKMEPNTKFKEFFNI